jgi:hypothetical protein
VTGYMQDKNDEKEELWSGSIEGGIKGLTG